MICNCLFHCPKLEDSHWTHLQNGTKALGLNVMFWPKFSKFRCHYLKVNNKLSVMYWLENYLQNWQPLPTKKWRHVPPAPPYCFGTLAANFSANHLRYQPRSQVADSCRQSCSEAPRWMKPKIMMKRRTIFRNLRLWKCSVWNVHQGTETWQLLWNWQETLVLKTK